jgi:hypothetical protein
MATFDPKSPAFDPRKAIDELLNAGSVIPKPPTTESGLGQIGPATEPTPPAPPGFEGLSSLPTTPEVTQYLNRSDYGRRQGIQPLDFVQPINMFRFGSSPTSIVGTQQQPINQVVNTPENRASIESKIVSGEVATGSREEALLLQSLSLLDQDDLGKAETELKQLRLISENSIANGFVPSDEVTSRIKDLEGGIEEATNVPAFRQKNANEPPGFLNVNSINQFATNSKDALAFGGQSQNWLADKGIRRDFTGDLTEYKYDDNTLVSGEDLRKAEYHFSNVDQAKSIYKDIVLREYDAELANVVDSRDNQWAKESADLTREFNRTQNELDRAISAGNLEETIRANNEAETLSRQRLAVESKQMRLSFFLQIASNPAILFFMKQSGMTNQFADLLGMDPATFLNLDGPDDPAVTHNAQSFARLSPSEQKSALFSIQAQTGLTQPEILKQFALSAPGGSGAVSRGTLG